MQLLIVTVQQARSRLMAQTQTHTTDPEQDKPRYYNYLNLCIYNYTYISPGHGFLLCGMIYLMIEILNL